MCMNQINNYYCAANITKKIHLDILVVFLKKFRIVCTRKVIHIYILLLSTLRIIFSIFSVYVHRSICTVCMLHSYSYHRCFCIILYLRPALVAENDVRT